MTQNPKETSLGFTKQLFPQGVHICQLFSHDEERLDSLLKFVVSGLQSNERTSCFSDNISEKVIREFLNNAGISYKESVDSGAFTLAGTKDVYFKNDCFNPERMLSLIGNYYKDSITQGFSGARIIGEMTPEVQHIKGGDRLLEYESRISLLLRDHIVTSVCLYDVRLFDGAVIMDILKVHPLMVVRGSVVANPFFIQPEVFLGQLKDSNLKDD